MAITKNQIKHLTIGVCMAYAITAIVFLGYAMLITYTNVSERSLPTVVAVSTVLSVMIAGFDAARGAETRGWAWGMIAGLVYVLIMAAIMIVVLPTFSVDMRTAMVCVLGVAGGGLGGILGINMKK
ncbi:MAG: TIGR04086 family membrane protein [Clostridiales bacterium]|jgi:putative membrane protein (TIGR04086 family)|nr:TIGR04086 family membrane protein [Clostridiales bacterium]